MDQVSSDDELREEYTQYLESSDSSEETPVHVHDAFNQANANTLGNYSNVIKELGFVGNKNFIDEDSSSDEGAAFRERSVETSHAQFDEFSTMSTQAPESFQPYLDLQPARTKQKTKKPIPKPRKRNKQPTQAAQVERKLGSEACVVSGNNLVTKVGNNEHSYSSKLYESKNVLVTGLSENTSADTLLYYMERMAEKDVEKLRFLGQGRAVVTTKEPLEFDRLAMKVGSRPLDDRQLSVERINLCDSMLVSNLPAQVTKDSVLLYFENVRRSGGGNVKDVNYSKEKHCAIVVFEEYQVVDDVISREHNLEGKLVAVEKYYPQISSQTITNSNSTDSVSYLHETPKLETRETHKRPQETQARQQETQARQQETQARQQETQERQQETQERQQETQERQQETQERPQETEKRPQETRDDMSDRSMTNIEIDNDIMQFIMSGPHANKLEGKVDDLKAEIQWERENETVTLIKKVHSGYVKRWEKNCQDAVTEFFDQFEKFLIPLSETIVAVIDDVLPRLLGNGLRGKAFCKSDEDKKNLVVVCLEDQRHDVCQSIESFLEIVEKEEIRKAYEKETIEDISHERMQFLQHTKFVEEIQDKNPELEIKLDLEQHMFCLEGPREQVRNCKKEYSRVMDAVTEESFTLPSAAIQDIVTSQRGVRYFKEKLALQNITAMLFKEHKTIKIVAKSVSDYRNAKTCLLESFYREEVSVNVENAFIFKTDDCQDLITGLNNNELVKISVESSGSGKSVVICGIVDVVVDVKNDIENIIERERIQSNSFEVPKTARRFLSQHCMDKLKDIEERLKPSYVSIRIDQAVIQMKGTRKGLKECAVCFFQLCDTIVTKNEKFSSPGLGKLMFGEKGRRNVKLIEMERKVIIDITKTANPETAYRVRSEAESIQKDEKQTPAPSKEQVPNLGEKEHLYDLCNFTTKEGIKVSWKYGNLEDETADILVNSANPVISNLTVCGKALSNVGGQQFIEACKAHSNVVAGEIACTSSGGNLACKNVLHAVCCDWDNSGNAETLLHGLVKKILAKSIQLNATSVALPTIGTGQHKFSEKVVFEVYRKQVEDFSAANPQTCLKDVQIIVFKGKKSSANPAPSTSPSPAPAQLPSPAGPAPAVASPQVSTGCVYDICNFTTNNGIKVTWKYGNIEKESASVLVNSAASNLNSPTACGKALNAVGGPTFIQACASHNSIGEGNIACTVGGNLQCQNVLHAVCCDWKKGKGEKILRSLLSKILTQCNKLGATSLAIPIIGTAGHKFREQFVLQVYKEETEKFSANNSSQLLLKDIRVIVFTAKQPKTQSVVSSPPSASPPQSGRSRVVTFGQVRVSLHEGDITQQATPSDGLINLLPTDLKLKNGGGVCTSILNSGGAAIQTQLDASGNQPLGSIIRTGPGLIKNYKQILNVIPTSNNVPGLQNAVERCLNEAKTQAMGSVSIPAIGTAGFNINPRDSAELILNAVKNFSSVNYALVVNIVVFQKGMVPQFEAKIHEKASGNAVQAPAVPQPQAAAPAPAVTLPQAAAPPTPAAQAGPPQSGRSRVVTFGQVRVSLHEGDITQQATPSDGLINLLPTDLKLKNGGGVCTSILNSGGAAIQTQLDASGNQPLGSIIRTGPGLIKNYKQILNVIPTSNNVPGLQNAVERCLNEAKTQAMGSVSIPAIGTAGFNINPRDSAELILNAVKNFSSVNYALVVNIVVFQKGMVPQFEAKIHEKASGNAVQAPAVPQPQAAAPAPAVTLPQAAAPPTPAAQAAVPTATVASNNPNGNTNSSQPQETDYKTLKTGQTAEVILVNIVASSKKSADESLLDMEKFIKENIGVARIKHQKLVDILSKNWPKIQSLARDNEVNISCASATDVEIRGCMVEKVSECKDEVQCLIDEYDDEERKVKLVDQHKSVCKIISKTVQWSYMQTNQSVNYDKELNTIIEIAFSAQENKGCQVSKNGDNYEIDFNAMTEKNLKTGQVVQISRKLLGDNSSSNSSGIQLPPNWTVQPQGKKVHLVPLVKTSAEYLQIQNLFISTGGTSNASQVYSIERVQNPGLYQAYAIKKQTMGSTHNEMRLFHGTHANNSQSISINNFNRSYAGINGVALGVGVYFAKLASTSLGYSRKGSNANGYFQMFVGKVLVGTCAKGSNGMKNPPPKNDPNNPGLLHDSTVDNPQSPSVFVVFLDHQCYPEYLVTFK